MQSSCFAQQTANLSHHNPMSRHLLSCLQRVLGALAYLLIGARAVAFKPLIWSWGCARVSNIGQQSRLILLLDSFEPNELAQILAQATTHCSMIWVLLQDQQSVTAASDLTSHCLFQSRLVTLLPAKSMVLHPIVCWQESRCHSVPACFSSQLWRMSSLAVNPAVPLQPP